MICQVVTDVQMLYLAVLVHLLEDVLIEILFEQNQNSATLQIHHCEIIDAADAGN